MKKCFITSGRALKGKNLLLQEQILSLKSGSNLEELHFSEKQAGTHVVLTL